MQGGDLIVNFNIRADFFTSMKLSLTFLFFLSHPAAGQMKAKASLDAAQLHSAKISVGQSKWCSGECTVGIP